MEEIRFEWDENKNEINKRKHGVSFEEAATVFGDADGLMISDDEHSDEEDRFILLGFSLTAKLLVVCHCYRETDTVIRIISARKANRSEERQYIERSGGD